MTGENFRRFSNEYPSWIRAMVGEYNILFKAASYEYDKIRNREVDDANHYWKLRDEIEVYWNKMLNVFMRDYSNKTDEVEAFERKFRRH